MKGSIIERHLRVRSYFSSMAPHVLFGFFFAGYCFQDLFNIARSILVQFPSSFFSIRLVSVHVVYTYSRIDTTTACKKLRFILSDKYDFHLIGNLSIAVHSFASCTYIYKITEL